MPVWIFAFADGENYMYIGHICTVQERDKTVKLYYYVEDPHNPGAGLYVRESYGHGALQTASWDLLKSLARKCLETVTAK